MEKFDEMANRQSRKDAEFLIKKQEHWSLLREKYGVTIPETERQNWEEQYGAKRHIERLRKHIAEVRRHPDYKEIPDLGPPIKDDKNEPPKNEQSKFLKDYRPSWTNPDRLKEASQSKSKDNREIDHRR